jgi:hypothetical protein
MESWNCVLDQFSQQHEYLILERELGPAPEFAIGRAARITGTQVGQQTFSGNARWNARPERWKYSQLTCAQVDT